MPLTAGTRLGPYEIVSALGAGGMGEVYRARDMRLEREVAIKVLPEAVAADPPRIARFEREARVLASLNHHNIAALFGMEEADGRHFLIMELVEGQTLAERLAAGSSLAVADALTIALQIAEALEAAHDQGIIHRDLKPANIKLRPDGTVKVLDFGLAKAMEPGSGSTSAFVSQTPTITSPAMTGLGVILGTAAYMSPEQAAGTFVDRRADIWSYGVVLWEMLNGRRLFSGDTMAHVLADVLRSSIEFDAVDAPGAIKSLLRRCLDRNARTRLRDIGEARVAITSYLADPASGPETPAPPKSARPWVAWTAAALAALALALWLKPRPPAAITMPDLAGTIVSAPKGLARVGDLHATPEISPDGTALIFYADGVQLRRLNGLVPEPIKTGSFRNPGFWSADSRSFVFSDGASLKRMRVPDGALENVVNDLHLLVGGSWSDKGSLLMGAIGGLVTITAAGGPGKTTEVTGLPAAFSLWPEFLPDSDDFLFLSGPAFGGLDESAVYMATLRDGRAVDPVQLMKNASAARYTPAGGGRILFVRNDTLYAQRLNRGARKLEGEPELVQAHVASSPSFGRAHFSVSRTGVVAWRPGTAGLSQVTVFDRQGHAIATAGPPTVVHNLKLSPDESRLLLGFSATNWMLEPGQPGQQQLEPGLVDAKWSPDGSNLLGIVFSDGKSARLVERPVTGGAGHDLASPPAMARLDDLSPDGKTVLFSRGPLDTAVFAFRLDGASSDPKSLVQTGETISHTRFSPDGRWIIYTVSSSVEDIYTGGGTYVQPFPGPGLRKQVTSRGNYPVWRKDGREIVYMDEYQGRNYVWSVTVDTSGGEFRGGTPTPLFPARQPATTFGDLNFMAVSRDGSRFYIPQAVEQPGSDVIHVRTGWAHP